MLRTRVITALIMLLILIPVVWESSGALFAYGAAIAIGFAAWEWAKLNQVQSRNAIAFGLGMGSLCAVFAAFAWMPGKALWLCGAVGWLVAEVVIIYRGIGRWQQWSQATRLIAGIVMLGLAWFAVVYARTQGVVYLLSLLSLVWVADIAAYFCGRFLGGKFIARKLAPAISPGKTWEGAIGGALFVCAWAWVCVRFLEHTYFHDVAQVFGSWWPMPVLLLAAVSVAGDLIESLVKRSAGVKDSSHLLPGHGGVLDRIDALLPVLPVAVGLIAM